MINIDEKIPVRNVLKVGCYLKLTLVYKGLNMLHTLHFFSSKCRLFHNATVFGSYIIRILHTGCAKI
jgi:hypothetical protein